MGWLGCEKVNVVVVGCDGRVLFGFVGDVEAKGMHEEEGMDERCEEARGRVWLTREASELRKET